MKHNQKNCYIIAGPNGAGKTTFAMKYLSAIVHCDNFINADMIAAGFSPLAPEKSQMKAARVFLTEIKKNISAGHDFAFETTLSGKAYSSLITAMKQDHWHIDMIYLWIPSIAFSKSRVQERVKDGGHNIPLDAIERRYAKSIRNLFRLYLPICDSLVCYDNSTPEMSIIFEKNSQGLTVNDNVIYSEMKEISNEN